MKVVALLSGGLDSSVMCAMMKARLGHEVHALTVQYGARHNARELESARVIAGRYCDSHTVLRGIPAPLYGSLMGQSDIPSGPYTPENQKSTVVPNRNMILLALAASFALSHEIHAIAYAAHADDNATYPDCRPEFVSAMLHAIEWCSDQPLTLLTPYLYTRKRVIVQEGRALGFDFAATYSCYVGGEEHCGQCGACHARNEALETIA